MATTLYCHSCNRYTSVPLETPEDRDELFKCSFCESFATEVVERQTPRPPGRPGVHVHHSVRIIDPGSLGALFGGMEQMFQGEGQEWFDRIASQLMNESNPPSKPTSQQAQDNLIEVVVRSCGAEGEPGENESFTCAGDPCTVCHEDFSEGEMVVELPCCHSFHKDCLLPWLKTHNTCPVCRIELPGEQVV